MMTTELDLPPPLEVTMPCAAVHAEAEMSCKGMPLVLAGCKSAGNKAHVYGGGGRSPHQCQRQAGCSEPAKSRVVSEARSVLKR